MKNCYLGIDLGATSGRIILSEDGQNLEEVCRFENGVENRGGKYFWNLTKLFDAIRDGLVALSRRDDIHVESIGVDTWGVDVVFIGEDGKALSEPRAYRDPYTAGLADEFFAKKVSRHRVYELTGIQVMDFNTLFQLYACHKEGFVPFLDAKRYLFIADYISYLLTGNMVCEYTALSTSQLLNPRTKTIERELVEAAGAKMECFPPIVYPGHKIGVMRREIADFGYDIPVIAVAGHDTASAVAAVPRVGEKGGHIAYLSSGTWSLMGIVTDEPIITKRSAELNFTNEGGVDGTTRVLKNITGMWILEQCRREWKAQGKNYSYSEIMKLVSSMENRYELFNPDDARFANPSSMLSEVKQGREMLDSEIMSLIFHSMANRYGKVFGYLKEIAPWPIEALYVIGGGARNELLNSLTQQAVGVPVVAYTTEATAMGNIRVQIEKNGKL